MLTSFEMALGAVVAFGFLIAAFCWFAAPLAWRKPASAADPNQTELNEAVLGK